MSKRNLITNWEVIDEDFINDFVATPEGLPILLMNILEEFDEDVELKRFNIYEIHRSYGGLFCFTDGAEAVKIVCAEKLL